MRVVLLKLKACLLYHENILSQKFNDTITQALENIHSASSIMKAVEANPYHCIKVADLMVMLRTRY